MRTSTAALFLLATLVVQLARGDIINNNNGGGGTTNNNNNNGGGGNIINNNNGAPDPRCQPFATNGAALESSSEGDGLLLCLYDGAGACPYSLTDGSSVAKGLVCPPSLTQDPGSSSASETSASLGGGVSRSASLTTASPSGNAGPSGSASPSGHANSSGHASASDTTNGLPTVSSSSSTEISSPQGISTSLPPLGAASAKKRIPAGAVAGVVVAALLVGLILALLIRRRCLQRRAAERRAMQIRHQTLTISPFELINQRDDSDTIGPVVAASRGISASEGTRQRLETELIAAQEKMVDLEDAERRTARGSDASRSLGMLSVRSTRVASMRGRGEGVSDLEAQLQASRQQVDMLVNRINELEANTDFAWGVGVSGEPPPEYV